MIRLLIIFGVALICSLLDYVLSLGDDKKISKGKERNK